MLSKIQSKNVDFCCAIFSCVYLHSERYKKLYIKRSFEVILYHIAGETGTKHRIVERCVFNRTMAAYFIFKFQNMNIQCYFTQKLRDFRLGNKKN